MNQSVKIDELISKGVKIPNRASVEVGEEVDVNKISSDGVIIHSGCRIFGASALISSGVHLGSEGPVTVKDCKLGCDVKLKGGYFENSVFLEGVEAGSTCQVRSGSILEECVTIAHSVGLKQTILFPFVKVGSLVNFCDCFMAGGTSNTNHSEVGSSYVHFNYSPNQDKATPSLIGDVPYGVMLNQNPIFLGGQGGLVGPSRIAYGTIIAAGSIYRKDQLKRNRLVFVNGMRGGSKKYSFGIYKSVSRQVLNNVTYLANLLALMCWYRNVRELFVIDNFSMLLFNALLETLEANINNRVKKFSLFCDKLKTSSILCKNALNIDDSALLIMQKKELYANRHTVNNVVFHFLDKIASGYKINYRFILSVTDSISLNGHRYLNVIQGLSSNTIEHGVNWLQEIVDEVVGALLTLFPSIR